MWGRNLKRLRSPELGTLLTTLTFHIFFINLYRPEKSKSAESAPKDDSCEVTCRSERDSSSDEEATDKNDTTTEFEKRNIAYFQAVDLTSKSCVYCSVSYSTKTELKNHMFVKHKLKPMKIRRKKTEIDGSFVCSECKRGFTRKFDMQRHILKTHPNCKSPFEPSRRQKNVELLNKHKVVDNGVIYYKCDFCEVKSVKSSSFMDHYNIHLDQKSHCCHLCGKKFRRNSHVNRHINIVHYGYKNFSCEYCQETFSSKFAKEEHLNIHTNNRPYMCDLCGKSFKQSASLYVHKMYHNQLYRYTCNVCDKKFKRSGELKKHQTVHSGKRDYDCDVCQKSFKLRQDLKRHTKIHAILV